jgi:DNA-binding LacI/PurR family transcriptional regulator
LQGNLIEATHPELLARLQSIPTVWLLGRVGEWGDVVQPNDILIGKIAAEYFVSRGHRRLAFLNPKPTHVTMKRRQASFTFFANDAEAEVKAYLGRPEQWRFPSTAVNRIDMVQGLVDKLLAEKKPPTAIIAPVDSIGATVARALAVRGLQAGRDISLMSCNNEQPLFMGIHPTLTTIEVHAEDIGRRAVDQLAWRIGHRDEVTCEISLEPTLIEGESVLTLDE